jgi:hypothetical protein
MQRRSLLRVSRKQGPDVWQFWSERPLKKSGGDDETRTRDLCRDSPPLDRWRTQNQEVARAVVGNRWGYWAGLVDFCETICATKGGFEGELRKEQ